MGVVVLLAGLGACSSSSPTAGEPDAPTSATVATLPAGPSVELSASAGLADRQEVTAVGRGFDPGAALVVVQCGPDPGDLGEGCEVPSTSAGPGSGAFLTADAAGAFETSTTVRSTLYTRNGLVDCALGGCRVVAIENGSSVPAPQAERELSFDPSLAGAMDQPLPPGACEAPHAPFGSRRWVSGDPGEPTTEALTPEGIEGDEVPVERVRAVQSAGVLQFELVLDDGVVRTFTTAPDELGGHYPNRVQGRPGETPLGTFSLVVEPDGSRDVVLRRANSGDYSAYAWHVDDPCGIGA